MRMRRALIGDVYEVPTPLGLAYIQHTHDDGGDLGQLVRVLPGMYLQPADCQQVASQDELYYTFYLLDQALKDGRIRFVGNVPLPERVKPFPVMRRPRARTREGKVLTWLLGDGSLPDTIECMQHMQDVGELTETQKRLSIRSLWDHDGLVYRLVRGWTPERDEDLAEAARRAKSEAEANGAGSPLAAQPSRMEHFLYFSRRKDANKAAKRLRARPMVVTVRMGADNKNWLVLATGDVPSKEEDMEQLRDDLEALAEELNGEYDGWGMPM
jgi:hypothetical protein